MVNEDVLTALKNGIERGESLQDTINLAISSGYSPKDIEEASRFVGQGGYLPVMQARPSEQLAMPSQKSFLTGEIKTNPNSLQRVPDVKNNFQNNQNNQISQIKQEISKPIQPPVYTQQTTMTQKDSQMQVQPLVQESVQKEVNPKSGYGKEILLLFVLLLLVGVLIGTFLFKEQILDFFSKL